MTEREAKTKKIDGSLFVETITCRNCSRTVLPKKTGRKFVFPKRCPNPSCRNPYYGDDYKRSDYVKL